MLARTRPWRRRRAVAAVVALLVVAAGAGLVATASPAAAASTWIEVAVGGAHTCGIQSNRTLWCWGSNSNGQLGLGNYSHRAAPARVNSQTNWATVAAGSTFTCALKTDGSRWCWGSDLLHQLGLGRDGADVLVPTRATADPLPWSSLHGGQAHMCGLTTTLALYCWGYNGEGSLGLGDTSSRNRPTQVIAGIGRWYQVGAGAQHTCGTFGGTGRRYCWGWNQYGQLGLDTTNRAVWPTEYPAEYGAAWAWSRLGGGFAHTCGVRIDGRLYCWGGNGAGELGVGSTQPSLVPVRVGSSSAWHTVTAGPSHTCGLTTDGTRFCWGSNRYGQLGINDTTDRTAPRQWRNEGSWWSLAAGGWSWHVCGIKAGGRLYCWGNNNVGQLGVGDTSNRLLPALIP